MKSIFAIAFCFVGIVYAQNLNHDTQHQTQTVFEILIQRGEILLEHGYGEMQKLRMEGREHLLHALQHEMIVLEALILDLKNQIKDPQRVHHLHHLHAIEEELMHIENRVSDELHMINQHGNDHHHHEQHKEGNEKMSVKLVHHIHSVIHQTEEQLKRLGHHGHEQKAIHNELNELHKLIDVIESEHHSQELYKEASQIHKHESTINHLIEQLKKNHHGHHQ